VFCVTHLLEWTRQWWLNVLLERRSKHVERLHAGTDAFELHALLFFAPLLREVALGRRYVQLKQGNQGRFFEEILKTVSHIYSALDIFFNFDFTAQNNVVLDINHFEIFRLHIVVVGFITRRELDHPKPVALELQRMLSFDLPNSIPTTYCQKSLLRPINTVQQHQNLKRSVHLDQNNQTGR
jgi:hypothetical protein